VSGHHTPNKNVHITVKALSAYICLLKLIARDAAGDINRIITLARKLTVIRYLALKDC
jgi:hypothetical protein